MQLGGGTSKYVYRVTALHDTGELEPTVSERRTSVDLPNDPKLRAQHMNMHMNRMHDEVKAQFHDWDHSSKFHPEAPVGNLHGTSWASHENGQEIEFRHRFEKVA